MVISHKYRYVFIELPLTGSTAISAELRQNYDGTSVLFKHATYYDFLRKATSDEKSYFIFSSIRNPLDQAVSHYFKYKTNHKNVFTNPAARATRYKGIYHRLFVYVDQKKFRFIQEKNADFAAFFLKFYTRPYSNWSVLSHQRFDDVIRFESMQEDFSRVLRRMGVEQKGPVPVVNKTSNKEKGPEVHYNTPAAIQRAKVVFGPFMKTWGYRFPEGWGDDSISWWHRVEYQALNTFRKLYWRFLRYRV